MTALTPPINSAFVPFAQAAFWEETHPAEPFNPTLALCYANLVLGFWRDCKNKYPGHADPFYIFVLGDTDARFSYLFLQVFCEQFDALATPTDRVLYVFTHADTDVLTAARCHEKFAPFIKRGRLDFAQFDPAAPGVIRLLEANTTLVPYKMVYPPVVIANHVLRQLRQDMFFIEQHKLYEAWAANAPIEAENKLPTLHYQKRPLTGPGYRHETHAALLEHYTQTLCDCPVLFPFQVFNLLKMLNTLQGEDMLLLCADKGLQGQAELSRFNEYSLNSNPLPPVNFHALEHIIHAQGGMVWRSLSEGGQSTSAFAAVISASNLWPETQLAAQQSLIRFNPKDELLLQQALAEDAEYLSLPQMLAVLRSHHWNSQLFSAFLPYLQLNGLNKIQQDHWRMALARIWTHHLPLASDDYDLAFDLASVAASMHRWRYAIDLFSQSLSFKGPQSVTYANIGIAHWQMGNLTQAERALRSALPLWQKEQQADLPAQSAELNDEDMVADRNPVQTQLDALNLWQGKVRGLLGSEAQLRAPTERTNPQALYLTLLGVHQAEALYLHQRHHTLARQVGVRALTSVLDAQHWIAEETANNKTPLAVMHPQCGLIGLTVLETAGPLLNGTHNVARFYYWITPDQQNQGYGSQALAILHQFAQDRGIKYLFSAVHADNSTSQRAMAKAGYERLDFAIARAADTENPLDYYLSVIRPGATASDFERYQAFAAFIQTFAEPITLAQFEGVEELEVTRLKPFAANPSIGAV